MTTMTHAKRAALQLKQALKHDAAGDETKSDDWLAIGRRVRDRRRGQWRDRRD